MLQDLILLLLATAPGLVICYYIYHQDRYQPEPRFFLFLSFVFGALSTYPALKMEEFGLYDLRIGISDDLMLTGLFAFVVIGFSEEFVKFFFLRYVLYPRNFFDEPLDGIVYSVMISMGFASLENVLYIMNSQHGFHVGLQIGLLRMFTAVPAHAAFGLIMGYFVGLSKFKPEREQSLQFMGLSLAVILHGAYDFFLFQRYRPSLIYFTFITLAFSLFLAWLFLSRHVRLSRHGLAPALKRCNSDKKDDV